MRRALEGGLDRLQTLLPLMASLAQLRQPDQIRNFFWRQFQGAKNVFDARTKEDWRLFLAGGRTEKRKHVMRIRAVGIKRERGF